MAKSVNDAKLAALLKAEAQLMVDRGKLAVTAGQVALELDSVGVRKTASETLSTEAVAALVRTADAEKALTALSLALLTQVRLYAETLHRYHFEAARAMQRWLFDESRLSLFCAYGWVEPSVEMELTEPPAPNVSMEQQNVIRQEAMLGYLAGLQKSTARFDFADLRPKFEAKLANLQYTKLLITLTSEQLDTYVEYGALELTVTFNDLPRMVAPETRVEAVELLDTGHVDGGDTPPDAVVTPGTDWQAELVDDEVRRGQDRPRSILISPATSRQALDDLAERHLARLRQTAPSAENVFWACSPVRTWTLTSTVEPVAPPADPAGRQIRLLLVLSGVEKKA